MTAVIGYSDLLLQEPALPEAARQDVVAIRKAGEKATTLTRQLMVFSRKQSMQPRIVDLNAVVTDTEKILRRVIGEDIHLALQLEPSLGRTKADPGQLEQVLLNLAINSRDAMAQGGTITIETSNVDAEWIAREERIPLDPGRWVMLSFGDTGAGMDAATQARVFEPFFTTKEPGKGTGLGLSTVYGIIRQSGGHVFIQSRPGLGTIFRVYLPRVEDKPQVSVPDTREMMARSHERVLLVEDEEGVRSLMAKSLRAKGYRVLEAGDGLEALRAATDMKDSVDILITDVILPNMGGVDLAQSLRGGKKDLPVIYLSGYAEQAVLRDAHLGPLTRFIQKPLTPDELARTVRELLDARAGR
jgi:CheY-like chemotaxis protein